MPATILTQSIRPTEGEKTVIFASAAVKFMLRQPNKDTKPFIDILRQNIQSSISRFFTSEGKCPTSVKIVKFENSCQNKEIIITISVSLKNPDSEDEVTKETTCRWSNVEFVSDNFDSITGQEDLRIRDLDTGNTFQCTGDTLLENVYPVS